MFTVGFQLTNEFGTCRRSSHIDNRSNKIQTRQKAENGGIIGKIQLEGLVQQWITVPGALQLGDPR